MHQCIASGIVFHQERPTQGIPEQTVGRVGKRAISGRKMSSSYLGSVVHHSPPCCHPRVGQPHKPWSGLPAGGGSKDIRWGALFDDTPTVTMEPRRRRKKSTKGTALKSPVAERGDSKKNSMNSSLKPLRATRTLQIPDLFIAGQVDTRESSIPPPDEGGAARRRPSPHIPNTETVSFPKDAFSNGECLPGSSASGIGKRYPRSIASSPSRNLNCEVGRGVFRASNIREIIYTQPMAHPTHTLLFSPPFSHRRRTLSEDHGSNRHKEHSRVL